MALQDSHMTQNVTRFLPDPTRNPDIDLAHLGYRISTLAALPSSFPVSRVKLADEGFYFRGQGDEMTCYSCHMRYSGWAQTDNPVEIHRRFSPQCAHVLRKDSGHSAGSAISNEHFTASGSRLDHGSLMNGEREHSTHDALSNGLVTEGTNAERGSVHGSMVNGDRGLSVGNTPSNGHATAAGNTEVNRVGHTPLVNGAPTVFSTPVEDGDGSDPTSRRPASSARATGPSSHRTGASASVTPTSAARGRTTISHSDSRPGTRESNASILSMSDFSSGENRASILSMSDSSSGENRASILSMSDFSSGENRASIMSMSDSSSGENRASILSMSDFSSGENRASILSMSDSSGGEVRASILSMSDSSGGEVRASILSMSDSSGGEVRASINRATSSTNVNRTQPLNTAPEHDSIDTTDSRPLSTSNGLPRGDTSSNNTRRPPFELSHSDTVGTDSRSLTTSRAVSDGETNTSNRPSSNASRSASVRDREDSGGVEARPSLFPQPGLDLGGAVYPMYQDMASRRRTFTQCQWDDSQAPPLDYVILCGMFYAGYADCVRCFYCGVGLKHWAPTDDVWTEHVRWRPGCGYLRAIKGDDFIGETQRRLGIEISGGSRDTAQNTNAPHAASGTQQPVTAAISTSSSSHRSPVTTSTTAPRSSSPSPEASRSSHRSPMTTSTTAPRSSSPSPEASSSSHRSPMTTSTTAPRSSSPSPEASRSSVSASDTATTTVTTGGQTGSVSFSGASRNTSNVPRTSRSDPTSQPISQPTSQPTTVGSGQNSTTLTSALRASTSSNQTTRNVQVSQASQNQSSRATATDRATPATTTAVTGAATAATTAAAASLRRSSNAQGDACDGRQNGVRSVAVESSGEERERLARLRQENNRLSQRLQCRVCHSAPIDTILMPCGHLVLCESCAGSVTSCPLCHDAIRATARVHME